MRPKKKPAQAVGAGRLNWWRPAVSVVARSKRRQDYSMGISQSTKSPHSADASIHSLRRSRRRLVSRSRLKPISPEKMEPIRMLTFAVANWLVSINAELAMKSAIVKPIPASHEAAKSCDHSTRGGSSAIFNFTANQAKADIPKGSPPSDPR